jgi:lipocalin
MINDYMKNKFGANNQEQRFNKQSSNIESNYNRADDTSIREEDKEDDIEMDMKTQEDFELSKKQFSN